MRAGLALVLAVVLVSACGPANDDLVVFAAASLADVAQAAADLNPERPVQLSIGPTSLLGQQIEHGAPADVFLAAHPVWVHRLIESGRTTSPTVELARGRLVIVGPEGTPPARSAADALAQAERIALADPSHVPAGLYAETALRAAGVWETVADRIQPVADVRAALVAVQRGVAEAAVVYASDATAATGLAIVHAFDASETPEIRFVGVAVSEHPEADAWIRQLESEAMQAVWRDLGFDPPQP